MTVTYSELIEAVSRMTGLGRGASRAAAEATVTALARALGDSDRQRLLAVLPAGLQNDFPMTGAVTVERGHLRGEVSLLGAGLSAPRSGRRR